MATNCCNKLRQHAAATRHCGPFIYCPASTPSLNFATPSWASSDHFGHQVITTSHLLDRCAQNWPFLIKTCQFMGRLDHISAVTSCGNKLLQQTAATCCCNKALRPVHTLSSVHSVHEFRDVHLPQVIVLGLQVITTSHFLDRYDQNWPFLIKTCQLLGRLNHLSAVKLWQRTAATCCCNKALRPVYTLSNRRAASA